MENRGGGHTIDSKTKNTTTSLSGTWTEIDKMSLKKGIWIVSATIGVKGLNTQGAYCSVSVAESSGAVVARSSMSLETSASNTVYLSASYLVTITTDNTEIKTYGQSNYAASCNHCEMRAIKVAP